MAPPATIQLASSSKPLPECSPNLMPFHIEYSGDAPISTYFRVKPEALLAPQPASIMEVDTDSQQEPGSSHNEDKHETSSTSNDRVSEAASRFVAAFRGRSVHGVKADLPKGYVGVVLRGKSSGSMEVVRKETKPKQKPKSKGKGRMTRTSSQAMEVDVEEPMVAEPPEEAIPDSLQDSEDPVQMLKPTAKFSSFITWHADIPANEDRDEYLRSLTEWTRLASEVHRVEDE